MTFVLIGGLAGLVFWLAGRRGSTFGDSVCKHCDEAVHWDTKKEVWLHLDGTREGTAVWFDHKLVGGIDADGLDYLRNHHCEDHPDGIPPTPHKASPREYTFV